MYKAVQVRGGGSTRLCLPALRVSSAAIHHLGNLSAMGALHNSLERQKLDAPKCHPNTRIAVINNLLRWIRGDIDLDALILWLYGAAGAGKSAIAHTLAEKCEERGWLLATFFFWRAAAERSKVDRFVATIAYQVARAIPASRPYIEHAVNWDPMIFNQTVDTQLYRLIIEPLQSLHSTGFNFKDYPHVIIVDGLDECSEENAQSGIVMSLAAAFRRSPLRVCIFIASRHEVNLQAAFNSPTLQPHLSRLALSDEIYSPEEDIYQFMEASFVAIKREHRLRSYIPSSWPPTEVLRELTKKSSGQFIFASTIVKYVGGDPNKLPTLRLEVIRQLRPPRGKEDLPYMELDAVYKYVLTNVCDTERIQQILGVLLILNPSLKFSQVLSTHAMDIFFSWEPGETEACLGELASVIESGTSWYSRISILHASLVDFLLDPSRSHQFYLCRASVLGDCAAILLHHLYKQANKFYDFYSPGGCFYVSEIPLKHLIAASQNFRSL